MQPVVNLYEAASYMCAYISKAEDETSKSMKQAVKESPTRNKLDYKKIKPIARAYVTKRECSIEEAVYLAMLALWLHKEFPQVILLNRYLPEKCCKIVKKGHITDLPDFFEINMLDRYLHGANEIFI